MKETRIVIWNAIVKQSSLMMQENSHLVMYTDSEELFHQNFDYFYYLISDKFMKLKDEHLDRHKIAAVIICAILKSNILGIACECQKLQTIDDIFLANEKLALNIALSDMHERLKAEYQANKIPYEGIYKEYVFPKPLSCERDYTEVICRDLYFAKKYFELDPLSIANFLFLLEAFSFEACRIDINTNKLQELGLVRKKEQLEKELKYINTSLAELDQKFKNEKNELESKQKELESSLSDLQKSETDGL